MSVFKQVTEALQQIPFNLEMTEASPYIWRTIGMAVYWNEEGNNEDLLNDKGSTCYAELEEGPIVKEDCTMVIVDTGTLYPKTIFFDNSKEVR